jgi:hypothetical protein
VLKPAVRIEKIAAVRIAARALSGISVLPDKAVPPSLGRETTKRRQQNEQEKKITTQEA